MRRIIVLLTLVLWCDVASAGLKSFIVAVPIATIDCSNLLGASGKIEQAVQAVNAQTHQRGRYSLKFAEEPLLHMTLVYVGGVDDTRSDYDEILGDLRRFFKTIAQDWMKKRSDTSVIKATVSPVIWPPLGKKNVSWLSYDVSMPKAGETDLLSFANSMYIGVTNLNALHKNAVRNARGVPIERLTFDRLQELNTHVSLGRFNKRYAENESSVFGLPAVQFKAVVDNQFKALPDPVQPNFDVNELILYMKDEQHHVQVLEKFSLIPQEEKLMQ
jgi:hypothetical protein